jgi:hypothetical protein
MLIYLILGVTLLYTVVVYYLCLTAEMPDLIDWREEGCECRHLLIYEAEGCD